MVENLDWDENPWIILLAAESESTLEQRKELLLAICRDVYSVEEVEIFLKSLISLPVDLLLEIALLEDYRSAPAIAALRTRTGIAVFELARKLSNSDDANNRALAVKIINRPREYSFGEDGSQLLRQIKRGRNR